ncbi:vacuolar serine protease Psp3 [Schizosaccharomyces osmophilus]|uniref:Vacuolar serine protease Psp3 n=1 Tax=Schizosaccharomyces osmophilus TaxID=2545709 RepID=A0AAE9WEJ3_9SCHI|nr:vacuolar serine protease Psp3 [Schizosaccharomyces osmophilus]WBW73791.1 vacuolar serine protease Psp3 [Schizosaccharomyces osmophilus]
MKFSFAAGLVFAAQLCSVSTAFNPLRFFMDDSSFSPNVHGPVSSGSDIAAPPLNHPSQKPYETNVEDSSSVTNDHYIVMFKPSFDRAKINSHHEWIQHQHHKRSLDWQDVSTFLLKHTFEIGDSFMGYAARFSPWLVNELKKHPDIAIVEPDRVMHITTEQRFAPWGLARVSHRDRLGLTTFTRYNYNETAGEGVTAYVIDTGINVNHQDFEGRASWGATIPNGEKDIDNHGHGTHVAGTIAGKTFGLAKNSKLVAVKVMRADGTGTTSDIIKGIEFAFKESKKDEDSVASVANMSLGGDASLALDLAVSAAIKGGLFFAVAAGNDAEDACNTSPSRVSSAMTVGSMTWTDGISSFSNHGSCVDIFAPGSLILSDWIGSDKASMLLSGTSMASPHVAGLAAYYISLEPSLANKPADLKKYMLKYALSDKIEGIPEGTPNVLAYNNFSD